MSNDPSATSPAVAAMQARAEVLNTLDGGTVAMRAAGTRYLPQWTAEETKDWEARRDCSVLYPALPTALDKMVGKPFGDPVVIGSDVPATIQAHLENADNAGRDIDTFCRDAFRQSLMDGLGVILVDYPRVGQFSNRAEELASGARPYWAHIPLANLRGWRTRVINGRPMISQLRIAEAVEVEDGPFGTGTIEQIRVLEPGFVSVYRQAGEGRTWAIVPDLSGPTSLQEIPAVPIYMGRTGFWTAKPPLEDLAWLNVQHWQSGSDQRNILHKSRVPFLAADRDNRANPNDDVSFKSGIFVGFENLHEVHFSAEPIKEGRTDLLDLESQMQRLAGELVARVAGDKSATESALENKDASSWLKAKVRTFQDALEECLRLHAAWLGEKQGGTLTVNTEWDDAQMAAEMITALTAARQAGLISQVTYSTKLQEGGVLPEGRTVEDELADLESEGPERMSLPLTA